MADGLRGCGPPWWPWQETEREDQKLSWAITLLPTDKRRTNKPLHITMECIDDLE